MLTQMQTGTTCHNKYINRTPRVVLVAMLAAMLLPLASCINDNYDEEPAATSGTISVGLSIQTRSITNSGDAGVEYVPGTEWENYIDIASGDFRIYFFEYDEYDPNTGTVGDGQNSKLIAEFTPTDIYAEEGSDYTTYSLSGEVDKIIAGYSNFKVMVIANWGVNNYPSVTAWTTTIDDICNAQTAVFSAFVENDIATMPSSTLRIPFFGLREYPEVEWTPNTQTKLDGDITMLRAVAKVEVILDNDYEDEVTFDDVAVVGYNSQGYCAPQNVYLRSDYDHNYTWSSDFVDGLHLVGGANDSNARNNMVEMRQLQLTTADNSQKETWACYLTEYDNTIGEDYSYITLKVEDNEYQIYFANYYEGVTASTADYDIHRNYLYRFYVIVSTDEKILDLTIRVHVDKWENCFDNEYVFDTDGTNG